MCYTTSNHNYKTHTFTFGNVESTIDRDTHTLTVKRGNEAHTFEAHTHPEAPKKFGHIFSEEMSPRPYFPLSLFDLVGRLMVEEKDSPTYAYSLFLEHNGYAPYMWETHWDRPATHTDLPDTHMVAYYSRSDGYIGRKLGTLPVTPDLFYLHGHINCRGEVSHILVYTHHDNDMHKGIYIHDLVERTLGRPAYEVILKWPNEDISHALPPAPSHSSTEPPRGLKQYHIMKFIQERGGATYTEIIRFAYEYSNGVGTYTNENRGYYSEIFIKPYGHTHTAMRGGGWGTRYFNHTGRKYTLNEEGLKRLAYLEKKFGNR